MNLYTSHTYLTDACQQLKAFKKDACDSAEAGVSILLMLANERDYLPAKKKLYAAYYTLAEMEYKLKHYTKATSDLKLALEYLNSFPDNDTPKFNFKIEAYIYKLLGECYSLRKNKEVEALAACKKALDLCLKDFEGEKNFSSKHRLSKLYAQLGNLCKKTGSDEAQKYFEKSQEILKTQC